MRKTTSVDTLRLTSTFWRNPRGDVASYIPWHGMQIADGTYLVRNLAELRVRR